MSNTFSNLHVSKSGASARTGADAAGSSQITYMGLRRGLYLPARSLLLERLRWRSLLRLFFLSRLRLLFLPFFLSLLLLLLFRFREPGLRLRLRLFLFLKHVTARIQTEPAEGRAGGREDEWENSLLVLVVVAICMRGLYLILSKVDTRTS